MPTFLVKLIFAMSFMPSFFSNAPMTENIEEEVVTENEEKENNTGEILTYSGVSLVAVGGAGSIIIAQNNKKKKMNEPSDEIKAEDRDDR